VLASPTGAGAAVKPPIAYTGTANNVTASAADVAGSLNPQGGSTTYAFQFGTTTAYGLQTDPRTQSADSKEHLAGASLTGLKPNTTYHYRLVAGNDAGTSYGLDATFTTTASTANVTGSGGDVFEDVSLPAVVYRGARTTVSLTLNELARVTFVIRKGNKRVSQIKFPAREDAIELSFKAPRQPGAYSLIIKVKAGKAKPARVAAAFLVK
jgi:hypothetical protein